MGFSELTGKQVDELSTALGSAYPNEPSLKKFVRVKLERGLDAFTNGTVDNRVGQIIEAAESEGWTAKLIEDARDYNPGNPTLKRFYEKYATSVQRSLTKEGFERLVDGSGGFENIVAWREKLAQIELQVCRVEIAGDAQGTGFLVGDDLVLTNYHVIEGRTVSEMSVRFDHKIMADGATINSGKVYKVKGEAVDESQYSPFDLTFPAAGTPGLDQLDYALLRLEAPASGDVVDQRRRAFIVPSKKAVSSQGFMFIVQHPKGRPLQLAFGPILGVNGNQTRITYQTNTQDGSSGAPGFDADWNLTTLHHGGDPRLAQPAQFNEGIPIDTIRANLKPAIKTLLGWA
jgi:hypothetical protein